MGNFWATVSIDNSGLSEPSLRSDSRLNYGPMSGSYSSRPIFCEAAGLSGNPQPATLFNPTILYREMIWTCKTATASQRTVIGEQWTGKNEVLDTDGQGWTRINALMSTASLLNPNYPQLAGLSKSRLERGALAVSIHYSPFTIVLHVEFVLQNGNEKRQRDAAIEAATRRGKKKKSG